MTHYRSAMSRITAAFVLWATCLLGHANGQDDRVVVTLRGVLDGFANVVTIGDIATVKGGDLIRRRRISSLDLLESAEAPKARRISKQQVAVRILLAGIPSEQFRVTGAESVRLRGELRPSFEKTVMDFLRPAVAKRVGVDAADVKLRLSRPLPPDLAHTVMGTQRLEHFLPARIRAGALNAKVGFYEADRLVRTAAIPLEIEVSRLVEVALHDLEAGHLITAVDVRKERRPFTGRGARRVIGTVVGKRLRRTVTAGSVVSEPDLERTTLAKRKVVIRSRDVVDVVAKKKSLNVKLNGAIALQQGAVGEAIKVKNPQSGKVLTARVVDVGLVEIRL